MQLRQEEGSGAASPSGSSAAVSTTSDDVHAVADPASVCMTLTQATAVFEQWAGEIYSVHVRHAPILTIGVECLPQERAARLDATVAAVRSAQPYLSTIDDQFCGRDKTRRALERLRRTVIKVLEPTAQENVANATLPEDARCGARKVLQLIGQVLMVGVHKASARPCLRTRPRLTPLQNMEADGAAAIDSDLVTPALETLLVLARTSLIIRNPDTYAASWDVLQEARTLVFEHVVGRGPATAEVILEVIRHPHEKSAHGEVGWTPETTATLANYTRCVAGAFHNIAGTLCQADRISHAVSFLNEGCELGKLALEMHRVAVEDAGLDKQEEGVRDKEGWMQLEEQLWHRWEILGVCQAKTGDRKVSGFGRFKTRC